MRNQEARAVLLFYRRYRTLGCTRAEAHARVRPLVTSFRALLSVLREVRS